MKCATKLAVRHVILRSGAKRGGWSYVDWRRIF
jgi:hypothetical protein